jgi:hypothetical protein
MREGGSASARFGPVNARNRSKPWRRRAAMNKVTYKRTGQVLSTLNGETFSAIKGTGTPFSGIAGQGDRELRGTANTALFPLSREAL